MAPHSSTLAWKIPWMEEPSRLQSIGSIRVGHDWVTSLSLYDCRWTFSKIEYHWGVTCRGNILSPELWPPGVPNTKAPSLFVCVCVCNKVLLKYKGDRESFWHRHQKGAERVPPRHLLNAHVPLEKNHGLHRQCMWKFLVMNLTFSSGHFLLMLMSYLCPLSDLSTLESLLTAPVTSDYFKTPVTSYQRALQKQKFHKYKRLYKDYETD